MMSPNSDISTHALQLTKMEACWIENHVLSQTSHIIMPFYFHVFVRDVSRPTSPVLQRAMDLVHRFRSVGGSNGADQ